MRRDLSQELVVVNFENLGADFTVYRHRAGKWLLITPLREADFTPSRPRFAFLFIVLYG